MQHDTTREFTLPLLQEAPELCTINLHTLLCRLPVEAERWGKALQRNELWVERMMQLGKGRDKSTYPVEPALTIAKRLHAGMPLNGEKDAGWAGRHICIYKL